MDVRGGGLGCRRVRRRRDAARQHAHGHDDALGVGAVDLPRPLGDAVPVGRRSGAEPRAAAQRLARHRPVRGAVGSPARRARGPAGLGLAAAASSRRRTPRPAPGWSTPRPRRAARRRPSARPRRWVPRAERREACRAGMDAATVRRRTDRRGGGAGAGDPAERRRRARARRAGGDVPHRGAIRRADRRPGHVGDGDRSAQLAVLAVSSRSGGCHRPGSAVEGRRRGDGWAVGFRRGHRPGGVRLRDRVERLALADARPE